jgi:hypothetical protein
MVHPAVRTLLCGVHSRQFALLGQSFLDLHLLFVRALSTYKTTATSLIYIIVVVGSAVQFHIQRVGKGRKGLVQHFGGVSLILASSLSYGDVLCMNNLLEYRSNHMRLWEKSRMAIKKVSRDSRALPKQ